MSRAAETNQLWESPASGRLPCNNPFFFVCLFVCLFVKKRGQKEREDKKETERKGREERKKRWDRKKKKSPAEVALEMTKRQRKKKK